MADRGAVYVAGAVGVAADAASQPLLASADGALAVAVAARADGAEITVTNAYGVPLALADAGGQLSPGETARSLIVPPSGAMLALQATGGRGPDGEPPPAVTLFVSVEPHEDGLLVIGQLFVRGLDLAAPAA